MNGSGLGLTGMIIHLGRLSAFYSNFSINLLNIGFSAFMNEI